VETFEDQGCQHGLQAGETWLKQVDENSKYFHSCVQARAHQNSIKKLKVVEVWAENPSDLRWIVVEYYQRCEGK